MAITLMDMLLGRYPKEERIAWVQNYPDQFPALIALAVADEQPQSWRAAWLAWHCMEKNDARVKPFLEEILRVLPQRQDGHQRQLLKILSVMELGDDLEGTLFDCCMTIWENVSLSSSVRITAFRHIQNIATKYPELQQEITYLTHSDYADSLTDGIRRSFEKLVKGNTRG